MSTAARASTILSGAAILFAGNAFVMSSLVDGSQVLGAVWPSVLLVGGLITTSFIILAMFRASGVLVTTRDSRTLLMAYGDLPPGPVFNAADTVRAVTSFAQFQQVLGEQTAESTLEAAQVELWIVMQQHRYRYVELRRAARMYRLAVTAFAALLTAFVVAQLMVHL